MGSLPLLGLEDWNVGPYVLERHWLLLVWRFLRGQGPLEPKELSVLIDIELPSWLLDLGLNSL